MSEILVLVDCDKSADGKVTKPTLELLTIARRLGEPSAAADTLKKYGAEKTYAVDDVDIKGCLVAPKADSGLITDAVDVAADGTTTQSLFAGNYTVQAKFTKGTPIITMDRWGCTGSAGPRFGDSYARLERSSCAFRSHPSEWRAQVRLGAHVDRRRARDNAGAISRA